MKKYPPREKDRWEHALTRPLRGLKFEMIELMRMDLFEYLDVITTCPYDQKKYEKERARDLRRIAARLAEMTPRRAKAARASLEAGRIGYEMCCDEPSFPTPIAMDLQEYWENAVK